MNISQGKDPAPLSPALANQPILPNPGQLIMLHHSTATFFFLLLPSYSGVYLKKDPPSSMYLRARGINIIDPNILTPCVHCAGGTLAPHYRQPAVVAQRDTGSSVGRHAKTGVEYLESTRWV
ncbi:uncharacterized protein H6S33_010325 [Morchella sextelata]|uniref:uncharacterized protein n=1 Tax=Morchella sextelata TaxID=1174677 RepID=UPI001D038994|nr:uncharacterized protein H6S33_010325 [Morchella sextelata]KAH0612273.1 hypothetical protein H6S33_010325 [Morchella sextelata]